MFCFIEFFSPCSERAAAIIMPPVYVTDGHDYATMQAYFNHSYYAMLLPPVPKDCPTPMGIAGKTAAAVYDSYGRINALASRKISVIRRQ